jgi:adenylate cyclase
MAQTPGEPLAFLMLHPGSRDERAIPIYDRIFIGRECAGIDDAHRLLIDDPEVSRNHLELRLDPEQDRAYVVDTSTNGTRVNGVRVERAVPVPVKAGDRVTVGQMDLDFRSRAFAGRETVDTRQTAMRISLSKMAMVVGDITNYSTISQVTDSNVVAESLQVLFGELRTVLADHRGTLTDYAGDALFATWELEHVPYGVDLAVSFAVAASARVEQMGERPELKRLRTPEGSGVHMGWGVVMGEAAVSTMTRALVSVVGDATNLAFRLAGIAGRDGRAPVIATHKVYEEVAGRFEFGEPQDVETKGRTGKETVYPVLGPASGHETLISRG